MDKIKILGLLKSFAFLMLSILGVFFKNGLTKLIKDYFSHTECPKNENQHIFVEKIEIYGYDKILGLLKSFSFVMLSILGASKINRPS